MMVARDLLQTSLSKLTIGSQSPQHEHLGVEAQSEDLREEQRRKFLQAQQYTLLYNALGAQAADEWTRKSWLQL